MGSLSEQVSKHRAICEELNALYAKKNADYGDSFHKSYLREGWAMPRIRLGDKYERLCALTREGYNPLVKNESLRDTLIDMANYAIMSIIELDNDTEGRK